MLTQPNVQRRTIVKVRDGRWHREKDALVVEEPLEIRLTVSGADGRQTIPLTTIMRTPGEDFELAAGFLFGEGIVRDRREIATIRYCNDATISEEARFNTITVDLHPDAHPDLTSAQRMFYVSSSCGVCGKASLETLLARGCAPLPDDMLRVGLPALTGIEGVSQFGGIGFRGDAGKIRE